mmetsp:Transcript_21860/g.38396  ORF Transcript_21860/g.38396 Transcript_21860/m.38396 type:complete len:84 (-) Transcript_21860:42-293(-)
MLVVSEGASWPMGSVNQKHDRKRFGMRHSYEIGISDTFFTVHTIVDAIPEHVGGKVMVGWPLQKDSCGCQALPDTRIVLGWLS